MKISDKACMANIRKLQNYNFRNCLIPRSDHYRITVCTFETAELTSLHLLGKLPIIEAISGITEYTHYKSEAYVEKIYTDAAGSQWYNPVIRLWKLKRPPHPYSGNGASHMVTVS